MNKYFSYDPEENEFYTFETEEEAKAKAQDSLDYFQSEGLVEDHTIAPCWGEIKQMGRVSQIVDRPPPEVMDDDGLDPSGIDWAELGDFTYFMELTNVEHITSIKDLLPSRNYEK
jgi:hypothetical protein